MLQTQNGIIRSVKCVAALAPPSRGKAPLFRPAAYTDFCRAWMALTCRFMLKPAPVFEPSRTALCLALALTLMGVTPAHAQWKWRDAQGRVSMSDRPPPNDVPARDILSRPMVAAAPTQAKAAAPAASAAAGSSGGAVLSPDGNGTPSADPTKPKEPGKDPILEARKQKAEQEKAEQRKAEEARQAAANREQCTRARNQLLGVENGLRVARVNAQGEREFVDDAGRAAEVQRLRSAVSSLCKA